MTPPVGRPTNRIPFCPVLKAIRGTANFPPVIHSGPDPAIRIWPSDHLRAESDRQNDIFENSAGTAKDDRGEAQD